MAATIPTTEPGVLYIGDTWKWTKTLSSYSAASYTLTYYFCLESDASTSFTITATASGLNHSVTVAQDTTAAYQPGVYLWYSRATDATESYAIEQGRCELKINFATAQSGDLRSHAKKMLDAIEARLEGKSSQDYDTYSHQGTSVARMSYGQLIAARSFYAAEYQRELQQERIARGLQPGNRILIRFNNPI